MEDGPGMLSQVTIKSTIYYATYPKPSSAPEKKTEITVLPIEPYCQKDTFYISH